MDRIGDWVFREKLEREPGNLQMVPGHLQMALLIMEGVSGPFFIFLCRKEKEKKSAPQRAQRVL